MTEETKQQASPIDLKTKNYKWEPDAEIKITGLEFNLFQKALALFEGSQFGDIALKPAFNVKADILTRMINEGIAVEFEGTPQQPPVEEPTPDDSEATKVD